MKKLIFLIFGLLVGSQLFAQSLANTYWSVTIEGGTTTVINYFSEDTMFVGDFLDDKYAHVLKYEIIEDTFILQSLQHPFCDFSIVGKYFYTIVDSTMRFELIEDECLDRNHHWPLRIFTQLDYNPPINATEEGEILEETEAPLSFFPNPSPNGIFYYDNKTNSLLNYRIYDRWGHLMWEGVIRAYGEIHLPNEQGIYFLTIIGEFRQETFKLVRP